MGCDRLTLDNDDDDDDDDDDDNADDNDNGDDDENGEYRFCLQASNDGWGGDRAPLPINLSANWLQKSNLRV